jgi:hypothetical protein
LRGCKKFLGRWQMPLGGGVANHFGGGCTPPRKSMPGGEGGFAMTISVL